MAVLNSIAKIVFIEFSNPESA